MTYLILNLAFLVTLVMFIPRRLKKPPRAWWITLASVLLLSLVFGPIIVALDIVDYNPDMILGLKLFGAPIEGFFYALYAACIVPLVWNRMGEKHGK
jgi:lycopene cyclase domain-containing protein